MSAVTHRSGTKARSKAPAQQKSLPEAKDYAAIAIAYAEQAFEAPTQGNYGRWMKLACRRFLDDLARCRGKDAPFKFNEAEANNACDFIEKLPHVEGAWDTPTITLHASDVFFLANLFGFRLQDGTRRYTQALKAIARKNAKSTIAAAIGLYCETCEGENGPQVISAATTGVQARIVWGIARKMVDRTPLLREAFQLEGYANAIPCFMNGGTFRPINSKAKSQDGLNPSCSIMDEVHAHKDHDLINVIKSAAGARKNPLFLYTTTEGYENPAGPWAELRHFAKQVLLGVVVADHFLICIYALDDEDKAYGIKPDADFDEKAWIKANPLMEVNPLLLREMRKEAIEAKSMPSKLSEFRIKRLNRAANAADSWVNLIKWRECQGPVDFDYLKKFACYGGVDLASTRDLTSVRLFWFHGGRGYTKGWRFVPRSAILQRQERNLVPYGLWEGSGQLIVAGDEVTDYDAVAAKIEELNSLCDVRAWSYDPWNAKQTMAKLVEKGLNMVEFRQGAKSYHPAMQKLEALYIPGQINCGNDPVLNWCMSNLVARKDENQNLSPDRKRAPDKIDDACALLMAIGAWVGNPDDSANFESWLKGESQ